MIQIEAPAKVNLTLEILGKRTDNYHEIKSVAQTVNLCDTLTIDEDDNLHYSCSHPDWHAEKSLVTKAVTLLMQKTGYDGGAAIHLEKRIPFSAGLGGDSSDAAAVMQGLNRHWKLRFTKRELAAMAAELGSDIPFFFYGGTSLMTGRGEVITTLPAVPHRWLILVLPPVAAVPRKTAHAYARITPAFYTDGQISDKLIANIENRRDLDANLLYNTFENIFFDTGNDLLVYRDHLLKTGFPQVHLSGTGPALFTLVNDRQTADDLFIRLSNQNMEVYLTETRPESLD